MIQNKCSFFLILLLMIGKCGLLPAQRTANVCGKFTYIVGDNDNITLKEAKHKCIELAKADAIKTEFGELITSDVIDSNAETNGESTISYFWENTVAMAKGEWLGDTKEPVISVAYKEGKLVFTTEVWGKAREIIQSKVDLRWEILKDGKDKKEKTTYFKTGERFYVDFVSPSDGYVAIYLILGENETACLLPYRNDTSGRLPVKGGKEYAFFDKATDPSALYYKLSTKLPLEYNQIVLIYSPHSFTKCIDTKKDSRHPNSLSTREFQKWLLKCQRTDCDMVVNKRWVKIENTSNDKK